MDKIREDWLRLIRHVMRKIDGSGYSDCKEVTKKKKYEDENKKWDGWIRSIMVGKRASSVSFEGLIGWEG